MELQQKNVQIIPQKNRRELLNIFSKRERVAAYCRVSTENEEQESSYELQVEYYEKMIRNMKNVEFVKIYADEGISGKSIKHRTAFMEMIEDCKQGKIDKIYTKSISRFSRNAQDCIAQVRKLKEMGISVKFEKEGLDSLDPGTDLILSIMSSIAEEESRSLSNNMKWTIQKKFEIGEVLTWPCKLVGYCRDKNGNVFIIPDEAEIIRRIFKEYLCGESFKSIADDLNKQNVTCSKKKNNWTATSIMRIITNEKYKGDMLLQKTYSRDFLSKRIKNEGQARQYYVSDSHPAIISKEEFELAQLILEERKKIRSNTENGRGKHSSKYILSNLLYCKECGSKCRRAIQKFKLSEKEAVWVCIEHKKNKNQCKARQYKESNILYQLKQQLSDEFEELLKYKDNFLQNIENNLVDDIFIKANKCDEKIDELQVNVIKLNNEFRNGTIEFNDYSLKISEIEKVINENLSRKELLKAKQSKLIEKNCRLKLMKNLLDNSFLENNFTTMIRFLVERIVLDKNGNIEVIYKDLNFD